MKKQVDLFEKESRCTTIKIKNQYGVMLPSGKLETSLDGSTWLADEETATALAEILSNIFLKRLKKRQQSMNELLPEF